ncbi:MAG: helix-turn-helix domain-containing protein [Lachnospiraceae bacterium]|nr:helix-turn-helix domain-containing protein [Lachnospiraceae bacterium]
MQEKKVPLCEKYTLSINEAAEYFRIGQKRLRRLVAENPDADYVLMIGNRIQIKRKKFEKFVDEATVV